MPERTVEVSLASMYPQIEEPPTTVHPDNVHDVAAHIYVTHDYNKFRLLEGNRYIDQLKVERLKDSFKKKYLFSPIQVNQNMQILDGQHRFTAAVDLELPIRYFITEGYSIEDAHILNTNGTNWNMADFARSYASSGNSEYAYLIDFMDRYPALGIIPAVNMLTNTTSRETVCKTSLRTRGGKTYKQTGATFREGSFVITNKEGAEEMAKALLDITEYFPGAFTTSFVSAYVQVNNHENFSPEAFTRALRKKNIAIKKCSSKKEYLEQIEYVYNYGVSNKVNLRF